MGLLTPCYGESNIVMCHGNLNTYTIYYLTCKL